MTEKSGECVEWAGMKMFVDYITQCDGCGAEVGRENLHLLETESGTYYLCDECMRKMGKE